MEKGRKEKYAEFHEDFLTKLAPVYELIKTQKKNFEDIETAKRELEDVTKNNDFENIDTAEANVINATQTAEQASIKVQETALDIATATEEVITPEVVVTTISARRTTWEFEIHDQSELLKKSPELAIVELDKGKVKDVLNEFKTSGFLNGKEEHIHNGIRFYKKVIY